MPCCCQALPLRGARPAGGTYNGACRRARAAACAARRGYQRDMRVNSEAATRCSCGGMLLLAAHTARSQATGMLQSVSDGLGPCTCKQGSGQELLLSCSDVLVFGRGIKSDGRDITTQCPAEPIRAIGCTSVAKQGQGQGKQGRAERRRAAAHLRAS